jgi:hypothetical protein
MDTFADATSYQLTYSPPPYVHIGWALTGYIDARAQLRRIRAKRITVCEPRDDVPTRREKRRHRHNAK